MLSKKLFPNRIIPAEEEEDNNSKLFTMLDTKDKVDSRLSQFTPCIRCGKTRIFKKSWTQDVAGSKVTYTLTVCPDPQCQEIVTQQLQSRKERLEKIQSASLKRRSNIRRRKSVKKEN